MSILILEALLFAVGANIDNLTIGVSYGIQKVRISLFSNFLIALITLIGTVVAMVAGLAVTAILPPSVSKILGGEILHCIGLYYISKDLILRAAQKKRKLRLESDENADVNEVDDEMAILAEPEIMPTPDENKTLSTRETFALAMALSINNLGLGIGAGMNGNILVYSSFTFVLSMTFLWTGGMLGRTVLSKILGSWAGFISGLIMMVIGLLQMFA
jgi:putative sporulation protein YtaF